MINFACSKCSKSIRVDDKYAGKQGKCPKCGNPVKVPKRSTVIEFACTHCAHTIKVAQHYAGKQGKCPKCQHPVVVPAHQDQAAEDKGGTASITCSVCDQVIAVAEEVGEVFLECPGCGSTIDASSGRPVSEAEDEESYDMDEALYSESAESDASSGPDRRLVMIIAGVALVLVVGVVSVVVFVRSSSPEPVRQPVVPQSPLETANTDIPPQPVVPDEPTAESTAAPEPADGIRLQFGPMSGDKRTLRMQTRVDMSMEQDAQQQQITSTQTITADLEAGEAGADDTIGVKVMLTRIQQTTAMGGTTAGTYDSAEPASEDDPMAGIYGSFVGKPFTVAISPQGEIVDPGLDDLFLAAAEDRAQAEDELIRKHNREKADLVIERANQRFGSRQARISSLKKQLEAFPLFSSQKINDLLAHLIVLLPAKPIQNNSSWSGSLPVSEGGGMPVEMTATYSVTAIDANACYIRALGKREISEEPIVSQMGQGTTSSTLGGSSQVDLVVDRQTGWLRQKEQRSRLSGQTHTSPAGPQGTESVAQVDMEITTTVTPVLE